MVAQTQFDYRKALEVPVVLHHFRPRMVITTLLAVILAGFTPASLALLWVI